jgi:hypothetical protein
MPTILRSKWKLNIEIIIEEEFKGIVFKKKVSLSENLDEENMNAGLKRES